MWGKIWARYATTFLEHVDPGLTFFRKGPLWLMILKAGLNEAFLNAWLYGWWYKTLLSVVSVSVHICALLLFCPCLFLSSVLSNLPFMFGVFFMGGRFKWCIYTILLMILWWWFQLKTSIHVVLMLLVMDLRVKFCLFDVSGISFKLKGSWLHIWHT